jgi:GNAT superfamily N-acetyltransferase
VDNTTFDMTGQEMNIVRLDAHRLKDLEILHTAVYGQAPEKGSYQKKYDTGYTGHTYLGFIAYAPEGAPAAYYGVLPCFISLEGELLLAAQSADTMTHPLHRKKGLFVVLAKQTYELCRNEGIQLVFGFPNQNSYHALANILGWESSEYMDLFILPVNTFPLEYLFRKLRLRPIYRRYINLILKKHLLPAQGLPNGLLKEGFAGVFRDEHYLQYKTYHSTMVVSAGEAKAWIKPGGSLFVGDMEVKEGQFDDMIKALKKMAWRLGITHISFQVSPGTRLHRLLAGRLQPAPSFPIMAKDLGAGLPVERLKFTFADIDIF